MSVQALTSVINGNLSHFYLDFIIRRQIMKRLWLSLTPFSWGLVLLASMYLIEYYTGVSISVGYVLLVLFILWFSWRNPYTTWLGILPTIVIIIGFFVITNSTDVAIAVNRFLAIATIWIAVIFVNRYRKAVESEELQKRQLQALFDNATEGIIFTNVSGEIVRINSAAEAMLGYAPDELLGKKIELLIPSRYADSHVERRTALFNNPAVRAKEGGRELRALRKDGEEFDAEISLSYFLEHEQIFYIAFMVDISERKRQQKVIDDNVASIRKLNADLDLKVRLRTAELETALRDLELVNKKEKELGDLKSRFVTMASHELRTPLTTMLSSVFLLQNYTGEKYESQKQTHLERIKRSIHTLTELMNDFLSIGSLEEGRIKAFYSGVDIHEFLKEAMNELNPIRKAGQQLILSVPENDVLVTTDRQMLMNILRNLVSNAVKYSPPEARIRVSCRADDPHLVLSVEDEGMGIPQKEQGEIFKRFYRAENATNIQGTGLGLNIVKKYVGILHGSIDFTSRINEGTTFTVRLPLERDEHVLTKD